MEAIKYIDIVVGILFCVCYAYQSFYVPVPWLIKRKNTKEAVKHTFAVLICGRNESAVVGDLLDSIKAQTYDQELITTFVMADNCTDNTADVAREHGAVVYTRYNREVIGKSYALAELLGHIREDYSEGFDGYFIFDADNILAPDYVEQMNLTMSQGHDIITSYRNSKNYGDNWISAGYGLWFLRESRYLNHARYNLGLSCAVSGTGYLFSRKIEEEVHDWPFHLMTEDIEFTAYNIVKGRKVAFCKDAEFFDEQPLKFSQSWTQRKRWAKGNFQVFAKYGRELIKGIFHGNFSCYDFSMAAVPAFVLSLITLILNSLALVLAVVTGHHAREIVQLFLKFIPMVYGTVFLLGVITTITEWKRIKASAFKKIFYMFTFPLFMATYLPISVAALFGDCSWKPIVHTKSLNALVKSAKDNKRKEGRLRVGVAAVSAALVVALVIISGHVSNVGSTRIVTEVQASELDNIDYVVIFAAETGDTETCEALFRERLDIAYQYAKNAHKAKLLIIDERSKGEKKQEKKSLYIKNVTDGTVCDIEYVVDDATDSTYDGLRCLKDDYKADKVVIVAQECRLSRVLYIANKLGIDAYGIASDNKEAYSGETLREVTEAFARIRDFAYVVLDGILEPTQAPESSFIKDSLKKNEAEPTEAVEDTTVRVAPRKTTNSTSD